MLKQTTEEAISALSHLSVSYVILPSVNLLLESERASKALGFFDNALKPNGEGSHATSFMQPLAALCLGKEDQFRLNPHLATTNAYRS